jgi:hypothetical protein
MRESMVNNSSYVSKGSPQLMNIHHDQSRSSISPLRPFDKDNSFLTLAADKSFVQNVQNNKLNKDVSPISKPQRVSHTTLPTIPNH